MRELRVKEIRLTKQLEDAKDRCGTLEKQNQKVQHEQDNMAEMVQKLEAENRALNRQNEQAIAQAQYGE